MRKSRLTDFLRKRFLGCVDKSNQKKVYRTLSSSEEPSVGYQILRSSISDVLTVEIRAPFEAFVNALVSLIISRFMYWNVNVFFRYILTAHEFLSHLVVCNDEKLSKAAEKNVIEAVVRTVDGVIEIRQIEKQRKIGRGT